MKIQFDLTEEQHRFLSENPDFNLKTWFDSVLNDKINEIKLKSEKISVIIAAAGNPDRMEIGSEIPIAMLKIKGKSVLERQIEVLKKFNLNDITVVRGFKKDQFKIVGVNYIDNKEYGTKGILYSFFLAAGKIFGKTILSYGDIIFEKEIIEKLIQQNSDFAVVVDRSWRDHYHNRVKHTISEAELVEIRGDSVCRMGRGIPYSSAHGEFIGLAILSTNGAGKVQALFRELKPKLENMSIGTDKESKASLTDIFNSLIERGEKIKPVDIFGGWIEIDTFEDYRKSWTVVD